ncbi:hypothetical protein SANA_12280 [Gottschalkiaceae bacterium SANA]|nr:hypothetical protein SANA_12280 [Gottschalkiaceae bacterium SANA]
MKEIRSEAKKLKDTGKYHEAIRLYEQIYEEVFDKWIAWEYSYCLKGSGHIDKAIEVSKSIYKHSSDFKINNDMLAWLLFEKYYKEKKDNYSYIEVDNMYKIALFVPRLVTQEKKSPFERIVLTMIKIIKNHDGNSINANEKVLNLIELIDPNKLSLEPRISKSSRKQRVYQSNREMYYATKTKVLLNLDKFSECLDCCEDAYASIKVFHHDNDIWIDIRRALCKAKLEGPLVAIAEMKQISMKKKHWIIFYELGKLYESVGDQENALLNYCRASISSEPIKMKVKLYYDTYQLLKEAKEKNWAEVHAFYIVRIKEQQGWNLTPELAEIKKKNEGYDKSIEFIGACLRKYWIDSIHKVLGEKTGKIIKIDKSNRFGFIKSNNESYYFQSKSVLNSHKIVVNDQVKFCIIESFDYKKNRVSEEAAYITISNVD